MRDLCLMVYEGGASICNDEKMSVFPFMFAFSFFLKRFIKQTYLV